MKKLLGIILIAIGLLAIPVGIMLTINQPNWWAKMQSFGVAIAGFMSVACGCRILRPRPKTT
jgi:hypothetical protein